MLIPFRAVDQWHAGRRPRLDGGDTVRQREAEQPIWRLHLGIRQRRCRADQRRQQPAADDSGPDYEP